jgi:hypothetical protein
MLKEVLADGERALVISQADEGARGPAGRAAAAPAGAGRLAAAGARARVRVRAHPQGRGRRAHPGGSAGHLLQRHRRPSGQIEQIRDAIELPYLHADLFEDHHLKPPKGVLQDADRQGGGQLAGQAGRGGPVLQGLQLRGDDREHSDPPRRRSRSAAEARSCSPTSEDTPEPRVRKIECISSKNMMTGMPSLASSRARWKTS